MYKFCVILWLPQLSIRKVVFLLSNKKLNMVKDIMGAKENVYTFNYARFFFDSIKWTPVNKKEKEKIVLLYGRIISLILDFKGLVP